jgi:hypothetical protein
MSLVTAYPTGARETGIALADPATPIGDELALTMYGNRPPMTKPLRRTFV